MKLNPKDLTKLPAPEVIQAALEELNFSDPEQAAEGHELLQVAGLLGALETYNKLKGQKG